MTGTSSYTLVNQEVGVGYRVCMIELVGNVPSAKIINEPLVRAGLLLAETHNVAKPSECQASEVLRKPEGP